jgi:hypothetical protein
VFEIFYHQGFESRYVIHHQDERARATKNVIRNIDGKKSQAVENNFNGLWKFDLYEKRKLVNF